MCFPPEGIYFCFGRHLGKGPITLTQSGTELVSCSVPVFVKACLFLFHHYLYYITLQGLQLKPLGVYWAFSLWQALNSNFSLSSPVKLPKVPPRPLPTTFHLTSPCCILHWVGPLPTKEKWRRHSECHHPPLWNLSHSRALCWLSDDFNRLKIKFLFFSCFWQESFFHTN